MSDRYRDEGDKIMRADALELEAKRMSNLSLENYPWIRERHRIFPEVFENRKHKRIIDMAAGIGLIAKRIKENYNCDLTCNDIDENCLNQLRRLDVNVTSFDLDTGNALPLENEGFDAVLCLLVLEHIIHTESFIKEMYRVLKKDGFLYVSVPNYASIYYMRQILKGRSFHDPLDPVDRYEFYAHVQYFTYSTLIDLLRSFGFYLDTAYLPLPKGSSKYLALKEASKFKAILFRTGAKLAYSVSPRFHPGPVMCFSKNDTGKKPRIVQL